MTAEEIAKLVEERDRLRAELAEACELLWSTETDPRKLVTAFPSGFVDSCEDWQRRRSALLARVRGQK